MTTDKRNYALFFLTLAREFPKVPPHVLAHVGQGLIHCARRQGRIAVALCNGEITQEQYERREKSIRKLLGVLTREVGIKGVVTGGDPRGAALKLLLPSGQTNDWGREGYCVPEGAR